ncbi:wat1-related protein at1g25270 [Phtheirospermum japonicum]|uniref:WAT1-related protein n=1 Tax=Phtheirospermum japonicum TaxID=374723 RepID=A0A830BJS2_9LAMI|nr:wat1-related protein at1g25270 [Phtheirospermum japonicum]
MGKVCDLIHGLKPAMMMVTAQIALAGVNIFYKLAGNNGSSLPVLIAYRFLFAAATVVPLALIFERKNRPKLTWKIAFQAFICALFGGSMAQNMYAESLVLTSATFAAAMTNLIPAVTFILAIIFRLERLGLNTKAGKAKVMGTVMCIGGAMLLTFYKGIEVKIWSTHFDLLHKYRQSDGHVAAAHHKSINHILGPLMALACCFSASISLIVQAKMSEKYPCPYSSTALISIMGSVQAVGFALCRERDWNQWKLGWNLKLLTVAYMGIVASGIIWVFIMSCVKMRGPLFVSVFNPLMLVLVALAGSLLLDEKLHLGR